MNQNDAGSKKPYETPRLVAHGSAVEQTKGTGGTLVETYQPLKKRYPD